MKYPKKTGLDWVSEIRNVRFAIVMAKLLSYYIVINLLFAIVYNGLKILENGTSFFDYVYFSFVTSLAIGYGDLVPITTIGKVLVIVHSCITALYFALMISILSIKMLHPRDSIIFSKKIIYNPELDMLIFRVINTNKDALINPEVRISVIEHNTGNVTASIFNILTDYFITYLGKYDFSYYFKNSFKTFNVMDEVNKANKFNEETKSFESRFRVNISITGSYGLHQVAIYKKYYANEIVVGKSFRPITYNKEVYKKQKIKYSKIENFWEIFESIES